jgi:hypothetical protein
MKDDLAGNWTTSPIIDSGASMSSISYKLWNSSTFVWRQLSSVSPTAILFFYCFHLTVIDMNNDMYRFLLTCTLLVFCRFLQPLAIVWSTYSQSWQRISKRLIWRVGKATLIVYVNLWGRKLSDERWFGWKLNNKSYYWFWSIHVEYFL